MRSSATSDTDLGREEGPRPHPAPAPGVPGWDFVAGAAACS